ncbi:MAG: hypothetical protein IPP94_12620 [Ignavibacteria bacterium]|nr:hypothetical protein [Ignavibacteria bacterium]
MSNGTVNSTRRICLAVILIAAYLLPGLDAHAQLVGTFNIPGGTYTTIQAAIADLNTLGVGGGGVTFNVDAGHTETFTSPTAGRITDTTASSMNPVVFQKVGWKNPDRGDS